MYIIPLVKSDLCLIGLFSCSSNFITRFVIPSPCIFSALHNKALHSHGRDTTFSLLFICLGLDALSPCRVSSKQESFRFRNQVVLPIRLYPVCIRNSFLDARWEIVLYFPPTLDFLFVLLLTRFESL